MVFIINLVCVCLHAQTKLNETLITIQVNNQNNTELVQEIIAHHFVNHVYSGKTEIIKVNGKKNGKDYLRFDSGNNVLYNNRYLISEKGNIIDLKEKKVLYDGSAKLIRCTNDSVIYFINDIFSGPYYSYFDLKTNKYLDIKSKTFKPDVGQTVELDQQKSPYKLYLLSDKGKELLLDDAGKGNVAGSQNKTEIPVYWVDQQTFLFPKFRISELEGDIIKYSVTSKTAKVIGSFSSTLKSEPKINFTKSMNSFVEFNFKDKYYLINPIKESMLMLYYKDFENDFSASTEAKPLRVVYHKGVEISKADFNLSTFKCSENYAAYLSNSKMGDASGKKNIVVYSVFKKKWETIATDNTVLIAGWIKNN